MKFFVAFFVALIGAAGAVDSYVSVTEDTLGNYKFAFDSGDQSKVEERQEGGLTKGEYMYVDLDGVTHKVIYSGAPEQGFTAEGSDIPIPVPETQELIKARSEHLAAWNAAAESYGIYEEGKETTSFGLKSGPIGKKTIKVLVPVVEYVHA